MCGPRYKTDELRWHSQLDRQTDTYAYSQLRILLGGGDYNNPFNTMNWPLRGLMCGPLPPLTSFPADFVARGARQS